MQCSSTFTGHGDPHIRACHVRACAVIAAVNVGLRKLSPTYIIYIIRLLVV